MEQECIKKTTISPHWLSNESSFWYRRYLSSAKFEFVLVDAVNKTRRPAFDHEKLADALKQKASPQNQNIDHRSLPFTWINVTPDGSSIHFFYEGKRWAFGCDGNLEELEGNFDQPGTQFLAKERPSKSTKQVVTVNFVNHTEGPLSTYWIDFNGKPKLYHKIGQGQTHEQQTFSGHVWKFVNEDAKEVKAIYVAPEESEDIVVIEESTMEEMKFKSDEPKEDTNDDNDTDTGGSVTQDETEDPQRKSQVFVRDHNVWLRDAFAQESQMSSNGTEENPFDKSRIIRSPRGDFVIVWQYTPEEENLLHLRESAPSDRLEPKVRTVQYLKPGDRVRVDRPRLFSLESKEEIETSDDLFQNPYSIENIGWNYDGTEYRFIFNERGHQHLRLLGVRTTGEVRALIEEESDTFIDYSSKSYHRLIEGTDEMLWMSERDGYNHLYLFDLKNGKQKNQVTKGNWNVRSVVHTDETSRQVWLRGYGMISNQDPYHAHLARIGLDGTGFQVLTEGDGTHEWTFSPNNIFFVDTWSRVDCTPQSALRSLETGEELLQLEGRFDDTQKLLADGWVAPERFPALGRDDETTIYGIIIRPSSFDVSKKYPILEDIYAGPHDFHTPKAFSVLAKQRQWADQGYVVVLLDGMGTNWRSKRFHDVCYKNLKDAGFADRIAWIKTAAETRPWMDTSKVAVMGGSAGGQSAVAVLIHHSNFYKVAIADSGCHDNRMDKIWWNEQWMGFPVDKSYEDSSNVVHAEKLQGALMLIVGELDDNVDPASTFQLIKALNDADKDFEFVFIPGGEHCGGRAKFALRRQERFLRQHLLGET
ncbi:peptidase s9b dipeptidylpeptidase iv domain protein [Colletotrichum kahawae]|uniref:Probable dipeptidyl-aminopeptidase B n=1 Tax=Colletotrichum kahawae TaxID=34407 RepID=A0AAE0DD66_COLKA|nr:peptidase s9b dipeptidylpeptidase iv domain protein [Colletotrichum kahawae]